MMTRVAILSAAALLLFTACEREEAPEGAEAPPANLERQTTPEPLAPTPPESPAGQADQTQVEFPPMNEVSLETGQQVYQSSCASCHDQGIAGAPARSDQDWQSRLEKGYDSLVTSAIVGYQGEAGVMPPKGGNPSLSNEDVAAAVAYMMEQ